MKYLSVCSGIEAATVAWHPLGWTPVGFGEIEKFPCQVLAHHYPNVINFGDMTRFKEWNLESDVNVLVGGTPCQSFSVAGLRKGLDDPRGNLMLTYLAIAAKHRPQWLVWENVPGVLSSNGGLDFASLLRGMGQLGYGFAYRILDAQYFGVAQRRRRVFVVGYLGNWRPAAAVLFERHSLSGHPAPSRKARQGVAANAREGVKSSIPEVMCTLRASGAGFDRVGNAVTEHETYIPVMHSELCPSLKARDAKGPSSDGDGDGAILVPMMQPIAFSGQMSNPQTDVDMTQTLQAKNPMAVMQPIPIDSMNHIGRGDKHSMGDFVAGAPSYTLTKHHSHAVCLMDQGGSMMSIENDMTGTLRREAHGHEPVVMQQMAVRRLSVVECERLQGFPDNYTNIKEKCPDGPRYKALGNSMAVPVMHWIGERISQVEGIA